MVFFFSTVVLTIATFLGKYHKAGCTLKCILDWAWSKVTNIKHIIDRVTMPLFDLSCVELNENTRQTLMQKCQQLRHLCYIFEALMRNASVASEQVCILLGTFEALEIFLAYVDLRAYGQLVFGMIQKLM